jgi:hypothetical protein
MTEAAQPVVSHSHTAKGCWVCAQRKLGWMFWFAFISVALNATGCSWTHGVTTVSHHNLLSRTLMLLEIVIAGYAYFTVPQRNRDAWELGFMVPWLVGIGVFAPAFRWELLTTQWGWPMAGIFVFWVLIVWAGSRWWRRSWIQLEYMVAEAPEIEEDRAKL